MKMLFACLVALILASGCSHLATDNSVPPSERRTSSAPSGLPGGTSMGGSGGGFGAPTDGAAGAGGGVGGASGVGYGGR